MKLAIYFAAWRRPDITIQEQDALRTIAGRYPAGLGSFNSFEPSHRQTDNDPDPMILQGSIQLAKATNYAPMVAILHWMQCLTEMRRAVPNARWQVTLDKHALYWDASMGWTLPGLREAND